MHLKLCARILLLVLLFTLAAPPRPARAASFDSAALSAATMWVGGLTAACIFGYFAWLNRPGEQQ